MLLLKRRNKDTHSLPSLLEVVPDRRYQDC